MLKWLFTIFLALVVSGLARPALARLGLGRLPGDLHFTLGEREVYVPLTSSVALSALAMLLGRLLF